jgi:hypothetical protein
VDTEPMNEERAEGEGSAPAPALAIACTLGADRLAGQAERWRRLGRDAGLGRAETADGLELRFRDAAACERELRDLVSTEQACCAWARWEVSRADGQLVLRVSSTPDGAAALRSMFGPAGQDA